MGNPNGHLSDPLPVIVAGGGVGNGHRPHQASRADAGRQPVADRGADSTAAPIETFGESTGTVELF